MPTIEEATYIRAPRREVWRYCLDVRNTPRWNPVFVEQQLIGADEPAPDVLVRSVARLLGRSLEVTARFVEVVADERSVLATDRPFALVGSYTLADDGDGTRFVFRMEAAAGFGGMAGGLADGAVVRLARRQLRSALGQLQRNLEQIRTPV